MRKKFLFLFIILLVSVKVNALVNIDLDKPLIHFSKEGDYVLQGFTNINNKLFTVFINEDETEPLIKIFDLDTGKLIKEFKTDSVGHANDVTYNDKDNKIYIVHGNGKSIVHVFDADTYERTVIDVSLPIRSMSYINDKDLYAVRTVSTGFYLNNDYTLKSKVPFIIGMNFSSDVCRQGWTYYNGLLYYSTWSWLRFGGDGTSTIHVYSISGTSLDKIVTKSEVGELEDVSFYNDKMVLGFNTYDDYIDFYMIDNPKVNTEVIKEDEDTEVTEEKKDKHYYLLIIPICLVLIIIGYLINRKKML